jgi:ATP-binding cassette, subfamily F, member 3
MLYRLDDVRVSFAEREVLRGVSMQQNPGDKLVLLGRNGCGKTTLLRVLLAQQEIESGVVERARDLEIAHLEQILTVPPHTRVLEYCLGAFGRLLAIEAEVEELEHRPHDELLAGRVHELHDELEKLDGYRARPRAQTALEGVGIRPDMYDRMLGSLSGGERTRVALARALLSSAPLLLLDEPTNHLDLLGVEYLAQALAARVGALLLVSHDRDVIDRIGGEILELHGGQIERYGAGYARYRRDREARRAQQRKAWELQRAEILRQEDFIRRNMAGQNTKQAQSRVKLLEKVERLEAPEADLPSVKLRWPTIGRSGDRALEAENLAVGWGATPLLTRVSFFVRRGERLAVIGRNGSGKTTLLATMAGRLPALGGTLRFGAGVSPAWYDQDHAEVPQGVSVLDALLLARSDWTPAEGRAWAGRFGFSGLAADADTGTLSGGERGRLSLARLLAIGPNLLILDEPTNHLDMVTCESLELALAEFPGAVVLVSHDRRLVEQVATQVLLLEQGSAVPLNTVAEAFARLGLTAPGARPAEAVSRGPRRSVLEEERRKIRREADKARSAADGLAGELEATEAELRQAEAEQCRPEIYTDATRSRELADRVVAMRAATADLMERWAAAEELADSLVERLSVLTTAN